MVKSNYLETQVIFQSCMEFLKQNPRQMYSTLIFGENQVEGMKSTLILLIENSLLHKQILRFPKHNTFEIIIHAKSDCIKMQSNSP